MAALASKLEIQGSFEEISIAKNLCCQSYAFSTNAAKALMGIA